MNIAFTTERLHIRFAQIADAAELFKLVNQANFTKYIGDKGIYTLDDAKKYIKESFISAHKQHGFGPYIIALHDETLVGIVGFYQRAVLQYPDLGFALKDGFEKKGYIFEAANTLLNHRQNLGINQVTAIARCDNRASKNVLQKLGFKTQGQVIIESTNIAVDVYLLNTERN